jgi:tRNA (mo5U34)-methyltransferase
VGPRTRVVEPSEARQRIAEHDVWYHTIDVAPGVTTPGWFDLRHVVDLLPWPDVRGKRCLDIGTFDGFFAFELERRGAAEVVGIDVDDHRQLDWPADARPGTEGHPPDDGLQLPPPGVGFKLLSELTGSKAEWRPMSIYDLDPSEIGMFDVVVIGSLLLHLRDPVRALEAVRSVCDGWLLSSDEMELGLTLSAWRQPLFRLDGSGKHCQWWLPSAAGQEQLLWAAGFAVEARSRPYVVRFNLNPRTEPDLRTRLRQYAVQALTGDSVPGVLHRALLARPRL